MGIDRGSEGETGSTVVFYHIFPMPNLNIAFDGKSSLELLEFVRKYKDIFSSGNIIIKLNDLLAEMGIE